MIIGITGLGLIGGSLAKAYKKCADITVYGYDIDESILAFAQLSGAIDNVLNENTIKECDCIFIALYPTASVEYLKKLAPHITAGTVVIDCCGTKQKICGEGFALAEKYGFIFVGGHPMAGTQNSGFKNSYASMFKDAYMVVVPPVYDDIVLFDRIKKILAPAGFGQITFSTAQKHDQIIAFTSQMAHVVSNAYIKSPTAREHKGFSAGSYKDLTRVARLNADMWAELFIENRDNLVNELDLFIEAMDQYRDAIASKDHGRLRQLLEDGKQCKEKVDGQCKP